MVARVSGFRAALEAGLVAAVLVIALLAIVPAQNTSPVWQAFGLGFFDIGCVAGVVAALRMRRSTDMSRMRSVAREVGTARLDGVRDRRRDERRRRYRDCAPTRARVHPSGVDPACQPRRRRRPPVCGRRRGRHGGDHFIRDRAAARRALAELGSAAADPPRVVDHPRPAPCEPGHRERGRARPARDVPRRRRGAVWRPRPRGSAPACARGVHRRDHRRPVRRGPRHAHRAADRRDHFVPGHSTHHAQARPAHDCNSGAAGRHAGGARAGRGRGRGSPPPDGLQRDGRGPRTIGPRARSRARYREPPPGRPSRAGHRGVTRAANAGSHDPRLSRLVARALGRCAPRRPPPRPRGDGT